MTLKINAIKPVIVENKSYFKQNKKNELPSFQINNNYITGVPRGYITFKAKDDDIKLTDDAVVLYESAKNIARAWGHNEITPYHIIEAAIEETFNNMESIGEEMMDTGVVESISTLNKLANKYAKQNVLLNKSSRDYMLASIENLRENNENFLAQIPSKEEYKSPDTSIGYSKNLRESLEQLPSSAVDGYMLLGSAFNTLIADGVTYPSDFLQDFVSFSMYKDNSFVKQNYMKIYNSKAMEVWNKLALGSNLFITYQDKKESDRIAASIIKTLNASKHGSFNSKNTLIYLMSDDINGANLASEIHSIKNAEPNKNLIFMVNLDNLLVNSINEEAGQVAFPAEIISMSAHKPVEKVKLIFFQNDNSHYQCMQTPVIKNAFSDFLVYSIPPIHTYETQELLSRNRKLLSDVNTPFTKEAREKTVLYADKTKGIFPDKAIDLMKRIADYYGDSKKKITTKDVDEFASIAKDLFNNQESGIIYDTGKTLSSLYGKDTTKKDIEALVRQIKTGKIGTRGIIIYSKDEEAGSGRRHTAQVIAGEAKIPFLEIDSSDFASSFRDEDEVTSVHPKDAMARIFSRAKKAAEQNENKTAILYINNFEEFAFSSPYLPGYKQAMAQLVKEMAKAEAEKANILVIGSTEDYYADIIPMVVRGFNQTITVDSPAFNKQARKDVITNRINELNLKLACKNNAEKEELINKLVKMTDNMSFVQIKSLVEKAEQIMIERNKQKASMGDFIEAYLQLTSGRTSLPQIPEYNKRATTSHECGHATNLEVMNELLKEKGKPWHQYHDVDFITLDPRGEFLGAVFEGRAENSDYPFEAMFTGLVCAYGGYSCEKMFFDMNGSNGISQDLAQATAMAKNGIEYFGFGANTGKISNVVQIASSKFNETVFKDLDIILKNAQMASDLITETYKEFNEWFTNKYAKLIGTDNCMIDGDDFRKALKNWKTSQVPDKKEEISIMEDMILDIIKAAKNGKIYGQVKKVL